MVPSHASVQFQFFALVIVVRSSHLAGIQSARASPSAATTATGKSLVACVVGIEESHQAGLVGEVGTHQSGRIAVLGADAEVVVGEVALVHTGLDAKVEHRLFLTVVNAGDACQVALFLIGFDVVHNVYGQILQCSLGVARHKLTSVHLDFLHLAAIDGNLAVVVDLGTWQFLHQFLDDRSLRRAIGSGIIDEGVFLHRHLRCLTGSHHAFQHHGVGTHGHAAQCHILTTRNRDIPHNVLIAYTIDFQDILTIRRSCQRKLSIHVRECSLHKCAVGFQQLHGGLNHRLTSLLVR